MAEIKKEDILTYLEGASILELNELVKAIEEKFGVTAAAPVAVAAAPAEAAEAEAPSAVSVILTSAGASKVNVIKLIRELTGKGLMDAKAMADKTPTPIKENISADEAAELKAKFEAVGATVEVK